MDPSISNLATELGINAPLAFIVWLLHRSNERLQKERDEARENERKAEKSLLETYQRVAQKAGFDAE